MTFPMPALRRSLASAVRFLFCFPGRRSVGLAAAVALAGISTASGQNLTSFGTVAVGTATPTTQTVTVPVSVSGTVASVSVLTAGSPNLDYTATGSTDTCTSQTFTAPASCQFSVTFLPLYPGPRNGAVVLRDSSSNTLGVEYLTGTGQGSMAVMVPGTIGIAAGEVGRWNPANDGQSATSANLYLPSGVALDGAGDIFIADSSHHVVREVSAATGLIEVVAGNYSPGYDSTPGTATSTTLTSPSSVAVDGAGNLYIADSDNNVILEVNLAANTMSIVAGNGMAGYAGDGAAPNSTTTEFNTPQGVSVDAAGDIYIADTGNNRIREISAATGEITTIAGGGNNPAGCSGSTDAIGDGCAATEATLNAPYAVAFDPSGNLYIPDSGDNMVRVVRSSGTINVFAGTGSAGYAGDNGDANLAELYSPLGVACDAAGNVYIADSRNDVVRKVHPVGTIISTVAGNNASNTYNDGKAGYTYGNSQSGEAFSGNGIAAGAPNGVTGAGLYAPYAIAVDAQGNLYIAEYFDNLIRKVTANTATLFFTPAVWLGQTAGPKTQTIENDGNAALTFNAVGLPSDANTQLGSAGTCSATGGYTLAVDKQCTVELSFDPTTASSPSTAPVVGEVSVTAAQPNSPMEIQAVGQALALNTPVVTVTPNPNPSSYGQNVNFTVTVAKSPTSTQGTPTGTVTLYDLFPAPATPPTIPNPPSPPPGVVIGTGTLGASGTAVIADSTLAAGTHDIYAAYGGNTYYVATNSSAAVTQQVNEQVSVAVANTSGNNPSLYGQPVTFTATVSISGSVPFGSDTTVSFYDGATFLGTSTMNASGVATYTTSALPLGSNSITATYTDVNNVIGTSTPPLNQLVEQSTGTTVTPNNNPSTYGSSVTFTATVTATGTAAPGGSVTFMDGTTTLGKVNVTASGATSAVASYTTSGLTAGTHTIVANYSGDNSDTTSSGMVSQVVNDASTATSLGANPRSAIAGTQVTFTATVTVTSGGTSIPTGTVNFYNNGTTLLGSGQLNGSGIAKFTTSSLAVGTYSITAAYQGDANDDASTSTPALAFPVTAATTSVALTASATTADVTTPVTFSATVTGNGVMPTGQVTFMDGTQTLGTGALNTSGVAKLTTSGLPLGQQSITAVYAGDANNGSATSGAVVVTVTTFSTQTELAASATSVGSTQPVVLLATVVSGSGKPVTGTVTFMNGSATLGTEPVGSDGSASLTITLTAGSDTVTAQYSGDTDDAASTSSGVTITVAQATDFSIQLNPASLSIPSGDYSNVNVGLNSLDGFTDTVALGCSSLPASVTCNFSSPDATLGANGSTSVVLTVDTNSPLAAGSQARNETPDNGMLAAFIFPGSAMFGFVFWRFRRRTGLLKVLAVVATLAGATLFLNGCGGFSLSSAKAGSYVIQVTATGEKTGVTHVANLTVQVTQ